MTRHLRESIRPIPEAPFQPARTSIRATSTDSSVCQSPERDSPIRSKLGVRSPSFDSRGQAVAGFHPSESVRKRARLYGPYKFSQGTKRPSRPIPNNLPHLGRIGRLNLRNSEGWIYRFEFHSKLVAISP